MSKDEMIRRLVAHSVKTALSEARPYWLNDLFEKGFAGYRNLSRGQLVAELQMRGLSEEDANDADEDDEYADDAFDAELHLDLEMDADLADSRFGMPARGARLD